MVPFVPCSPPLYITMSREVRASKRCVESESEDSEGEKTVSPKHGNKVTKTGTAGTANVAKGRDAMRAMRRLVDAMHSGERKDNFMEAVNALTEQYDEVILSYVAKRDGLRLANETMEQMSEAVADLRDEAGEQMELLKKLLKQRPGCGCGAGKATNTAGRCTGTCGCARMNLQCNDKCGCGEFCTRPGDKKSNADNIANRRQRGILRFGAAQGAGASAAAAAADNEA